MIVVANLGGLGLHERVWDLSFGFVLGKAASASWIDARIDDALTSAFFLLVGIEIERELIDGELSDLSDAALPLGAGAPLSRFPE